jgi:hypothetical protein
VFVSFVTPELLYAYQYILKAGILAAYFTVFKIELNVEVSDTTKAHSSYCARPIIFMPIQFIN